MNRDEDVYPRPWQRVGDRPAEPGGWEERARTEPGWEKRNERRDQLREGRDHPLHHGHSLHGPHARDGNEERETERRPVTPVVPSLIPT